MTEDRPDNLIYGHFGIPSYDVDHHAWFFPRTPSAGPRLLPLGDAQLVHGADTTSAGSGKVSSSCFGSGLLNNKRVPKSGAVLSSVNGNDLDKKRFVLSERDRLNSSDLIAFGKAIDRSRPKRAEDVPLLVAVSTSSEDLIKLILLRKEHLGWQGHEHAGICRPVAQGAETGWWSAKGSSVQQIVFAVDLNGEQTSTFAVRYGGNLSIFHPFVTSKPSPTGDISADGLRLPSSRVQANEIMRLDWCDFGQAQFVDICFNPWDDNQFATVDRFGRWSVWHFEKLVAERTAWDLSRSYEGCGVHVTADTSLDSNWAKVSWACDSQSIVIAHQKSLNVIQLGSSPRNQELAKLILRQENDCVLDMRCCPSFPGFFWILSTSKISWVRIRTTQATNLSTWSAEASFQAECLISWVHYLDLQHQHVTMEIHSYAFQASASEPSNARSIILLSPCIGHSTTVFTFEYDFHQKRAQSIVDPYIMSSGLHDSRHSVVAAGPHTARSIFAITLLAVNYGDLHGHPPSDIARKYSEEGFQFLQMATLGSDFGLRERLYVLVPSETTDIPSQPQLLQKTVLAKSLPTVEENFIRDDQSDSEENSTLSLGVSLLGPTRRSKPLNSDRRTISLEWLRSQLLNTPTRSWNQPKAIASHAMLAHEHVNGFPKPLTGSPTIYRTILEMMRDLPTGVRSHNPFGEVEDCVQYLFRHLQNIDPLENSSPDVIKLHLGLSDVIDMKPMSMQETRHLSESLGSLYGTQMARNMRDVAATGKDQAISLAVGYLQLASYRPSQPIYVQPAHSASDSVALREETYTLPVRFGRPTMKEMIGKETTVPVPRDPAGQVTNEPYRGASEPSTTKSSRQPARQTQNNPPQTNLPTKFSVLIDQWELGSSPDDRNWTYITQHLTATRIDAAETEVEPSKASKRRRPKTLEAKQGANIVAPGLNEKVAGGSQPLPANRPATQHELESYRDIASTQDSLMPEVSTQPVAGSHAQRPKGKGSVKKKRKAGF